MEATMTTTLKVVLATASRYILIRGALSFSVWAEIFHCLEFILNDIFNAVCAQPVYDSHQPEFKHCKEQIISPRLISPQLEISQQSWSWHASFNPWP